jgi:hypothetical protein
MTTILRPLTCCGISAAEMEILPKIGLHNTKAALAGGLLTLCETRSHTDLPAYAHGTSEIFPNVPARLLLGPAVKNNWLIPPFFPAPSPNPIPHN